MLKYDINGQKGPFNIQKVEYKHKVFGVIIISVIVCYKTIQFHLFFL